VDGAVAILEHVGSLPTEENLDRLTAGVLREPGG
jgi:hypothetical protein